jgi:hypothetical protein
MGVQWQDLPLEEFRDNPLPPETLRSLRYMCDVEYHTVCYLRDMLVTPSHQDPGVTAFMTMWNMEEFWHGEALAEVLRMHDVTLDYDHLKAKRITMGWRDKLGPVKQSLLAGLVGQDFVAVHMIWGAANEWSAVAADNRTSALRCAVASLKTVASHSPVASPWTSAVRIVRVRRSSGCPEIRTASPSTSVGVQ